MHRPILMLICLSALHSSQAAAGDYNCALKSSNEYVSDFYGMYEEADSQSECLTLCRVYARSNVEIMADPEKYDPPADILEWTCLYEQIPFYRKALKPTASEGFLPEPPGGQQSAVSADEEAAEQQHKDAFPAQAFGELAGMFTYHAMACARLDDSLSEAQLAAARAGISSMKEEFSSDVHDIWDAYFRIGAEKLEAEGLTYDEERCADTLEALHNGGPFDMEIVPKE